MLTNRRGQPAGLPEVLSPGPHFPTSQRHIPEQPASQGLLKEARAAQITSMNREGHSGRRTGEDALSERRTGGPSRAGKRG